VRARGNLTTVAGNACPRAVSLISIGSGVNRVAPWDSTTDLLNPHRPKAGSEPPRSCSGGR
jgi:hypothetical protein